MNTSYFGRAWKLTVTPQATGEEWTVSNSSWDTEALKATFDVEQPANSSYWYADIVIYNFTAAAAQVIQKGDPVTLTAGYQSPGSGVIFQGKVFQPLWERANDTDYTLTLHCLVGLFEDETGYVTVPIAAGLSQAKAVEQVAEAAGLAVESLDPVLSTRLYPRGKSIAERARIFFDQVAIDNQLHCWIGWKGVNIRSLASTSTVPDQVYAPPLTSTSQTQTARGITKYTLIGTPQQTEMGVAFRVLLDSDLQLGALVKIENALVKRLPQVPMQYQVPFLKDGLYVVAGLRHTGDTRGRDWYSEVNAVVPNWDKIRNTLYSR